MSLCEARQCFSFVKAWWDALISISLPKRAFFYYYLLAKASDLILIRTFFFWNEKVTYDLWVMLLFCTPSVIQCVTWLWIDTILVNCLCIRETPCLFLVVLIMWWQVDIFSWWKLCNLAFKLVVFAYITLPKWDINHCSMQDFMVSSFSGGKTSSTLWRRRCRSWSDGSPSCFL